NCRWITKYNFELTFVIGGSFCIKVKYRLKERSDGAKRRVKLNHLCQKYPQTAKVCKSRLFVTKVVLICTMRLAHERSECDKHGANKNYFSYR
ncbi:hypothetical protein TSAR_008204, partial [Trichomalopsis sarcophagae]